MNRRVKQLFKSMVMASVIGVIMAAQMLTAFAASGRIAFSDKSVTAGTEVSINMKITTSSGALSNATVVLSYDASMLEFISGTAGASGGAGSIRISIGGDTADAQTLSSELKFKALQAGTAKITVSTQEVYDTDNQMVDITQLGNSTITIGALANASNNAALSGLEVSPGNLSPEFSADVKSYTASVGADVEKIAVSATLADEKARIAISGSEGLQMGENQVVCKVIAEDGQTVNDYVIVVTRAEGGESVSSTPTTEPVEVVTAEKMVTIIPLDEGVEIPEGFKECLLRIDGKEVQGWVWESETDYQYCIFYGTNSAGEKGFYRYDIKEKTMQRYFMDPMSAAGVSKEQYVEVASNYNALLEDYKLRLYIIIGLIAVSVALLIAVIILVSQKGKSGHDDDRYDNYKEKLKETRRPSRRITREEEYMRGMEAEEELVNAPVVDDLDTAERKLKETLAREAGRSSDKPIVRSRPSVREEKPVRKEDKEEDDFEFLDLDL